MTRYSVMIPRLVSILALATICLEWRYPWFAFATLMILSAIIISVSVDRKVVARIWIIAFIAGPLAETLAIHFGAWRYAFPTDPFTIPLWLAPCWGLSGVFFYYLILRLSKQGK
jgi:hypothetical protein